MGERLTEGRRVPSVTAQAVVKTEAAAEAAAAAPAAATSVLIFIFIFHSHFSFLISHFRFRVVYSGCYEPFFRDFGSHRPQDKCI